MWLLNKASGFAYKSQCFLFILLKETIQNRRGNISGVSSFIKKGNSFLKYIVVSPIDNKEYIYKGTIVNCVSDYLNDSPL